MYSQNIFKCRRDATMNFTLDAQTISHFCFCFCFITNTERNHLNVYPVMKISFKAKM